MSLPDRIVLDPEVLAGKPVIRGTRLAVEFSLELLASGQKEAEILENYRAWSRRTFWLAWSTPTAWLRNTVSTRFPRRRP